MLLARRFRLLSRHSDEGHQIVCEIAFKKVKPSTRAKIIELIKIKGDENPSFSTFSEACTWADHPRKREPEHFVNLPAMRPASRTRAVWRLNVL
jgi:hypothetical protein